VSRSQFLEKTTESEQISDTFSDAIAAPDVVEEALAQAIVGATKAGRWDIVAQLARELEVRRLARSAPNVVALARKTGKTQ